MKRCAVALLSVLLCASVALASGELKAPKDAKCPFCGMFVYKYPDWVAVVTYKDGASLWFDGAKDMFKHLQDPAKFGPPRKAEDIVSVKVTEYYDLAAVDAKAAWYVIGSDVYGPMGKELVPFLSEADAKRFMADHKGKRIVRFQDVTPALIRTLDE